MARISFATKSVETLFFIVFATSPFTARVEIPVFVLVAKNITIKPEVYIPIVGEKETA